MMAIDQLYDIYLQHPQITTDSRNVPDGSIFVALKGERFDGNQYAASAIKAGAAYAIVDDKTIADVIGDQAILVDDGLATLSALANHHRLKLKAAVIAITGSNGKTTTKELLAAVLGQAYTVHATRGNFNNHIGLPLTLLEVRTNVEAVILEMGANHQGEIAHLCKIAAPQYGVITNIGEAHLEGFGGIEGVKKGKGELYDFLRQSEGTAFINLDAEHLDTMVDNSLKRINYSAATVLDSSDDTSTVKLLNSVPTVELAFLDEQGEVVEVKTHLPGLHNFENIKAAVAFGKYFKVSGQNIKAGLESYQPDNNRSERKTVGGVDFWLDAYNANPSSVQAALQAFSASNIKRRAVVLGDMLELGEASEAAHLRIAKYISELPIDDCILVGHHYQKIATSLAIKHFDNVSDLSNWFWQQNWSNTTVLLKGSRGIALEKLLHAVTED